MEIRVHRFVLEVLLGGYWDQVGVVLLAALWIRRVAGLTSVIGLVFVFVESDGLVQVELIVIATETLDLFWRSRWEVMGTRLRWYCSRHLWIERVAGLTSVIELVFVFVESDGRVDLFRRSHWEVMGTIRLGWYCSRHLWIERVGFIFEFIVIESYCPE